MSHYLFKPRKSFIRDIKYLSKIDRSIVFKINDAISILKCGEKLPSEFKDHSLNGLYEVIVNFIFEIHLKILLLVKVMTLSLFIKLDTLN